MYSAITFFFLVGDMLRFLKTVYYSFITPSTHLVNEEGSLLPIHNDWKTITTIYWLQKLEARSAIFKFKILYNY